MHFRAYVAATLSNKASILFTVLAISARHCELTKGSNDYKSHKYKQQCLKVLIPSLNDITKALQDTVLASAVLLRLLDEMTEPTECQSINSHAVSASILL
ncbi:hypothetical protein V8C42DRAFT_117826 [Trichoderma barbatum]